MTSNGRTRLMLPRLFSTLLIPIMASCGTDPSESGNTNQQQASNASNVSNNGSKKLSCVTPDTWHSITIANNQTIDLPPSVSHQVGQGIDSYVGEFRGGDLEIRYDVGGFAGNYIEHHYGKLWSRTDPGCFSEIQYGLFELDQDGLVFMVSVPQAHGNFWMSVNSAEDLRIDQLLNIVGTFRPLE